MIFGNGELKTYLSIEINNATINRAESTKYLGVLINYKLTWKHHISLLKSKLSKCCTVTYKTSFLIDRRGKRILYYSLFSPYIMYCAEIWGNTYAANLKCLILLQRRVVRLICGAQRLDHSLIHCKSVHLFKKNYTVQVLHSCVTNKIMVKKINCIAIYLFVYIYTQNLIVQHMLTLV